MASGEYAALGPGNDGAGRIPSYLHRMAAIIGISVSLGLTLLIFQGGPQHMAQRYFQLAAQSKNTAKTPDLPPGWELARDVLQVPGVGSLHGLEKSGVRLYAGIKYAKAPVGELRWRAPQALPEISQGTQVNATSFGWQCPQMVGGNAEGNEDCLTLNIFTRVPTSLPTLDSRMPVLVWIPGGSWAVGSTNIGDGSHWGPVYDGSNFALLGAVVVTVQFRLGVFSFLGGADVRKREVRGNFGIQDERLALRWVQKHISAFGGDPRRVMLFGQSTGAADIMLHLMSPDSAGLFSSAAFQSGASLDGLVQPWTTAEEQYKKLLESTSCPDLQCLLKLPAEAVVSARIDGLWEPFLDGLEIKRQTWISAAEGEVSKVPVIVGFNRDEGADPWRTSGDSTVEDFLAVLEGVGVPESMWPQLQAEYQARVSDWYWAITQFVADFSFGCPSRMFAEAMLNAGLPVFAYKFSQPPSVSQAFLLGASSLERPQHLFGAYHGSELFSVFGNRVIPAWHAELTRREQSVAARVGRHWLDMAAAGDPGGRWPRLTRPARQWLLLGTEGFTVEEERLLNCTLIDMVRALTRRQPWKREGPPTT